MSQLSIFNFFKHKTIAPFILMIIFFKNKVNEKSNPKVTFPQREF